MNNHKPFKDKMCKVIFDPYQEEALMFYPGSKINLSWIIKNDTKKSWPRTPIFRNVSTSADVIEFMNPSKYSPTLDIDSILEP